MTGAGSIRPWKILIVDDEPDVHLVTKLALQRKKVFDRGLEFLGAFSGLEAKPILEANPDIACVLLDVVMEADDSGLELVKFIRDEIGNKSVRIILRTGQPGQAPEADVILKYEINDYKQKSELTAEKLFSSVVTAIRSYRDIRTIEQSRRGMEMIIAASADMLRSRSIQLFAEGVLNQIISLLHISWDAVYIRTPKERASGFTAKGGDEHLTFLAGAGRFAGLTAAAFPDGLDGRQRSLVEKAVATEANVYQEGALAIVLKDRARVQGVLYLEDCPPLAEIGLDLIEIFAHNVSAAFSNILLHEQLERKVDERTRELRDAQARMLQQEKMAAIGQLAAGVAHEVNNPMSFVASNLLTLSRYVDAFSTFYSAAIEGSPGAPARLAETGRDLELDFKRGDAAVLLEESLDGVRRVQKVVQSLRTFSGVDAPKSLSADLNLGIEATIEVLGDQLSSKAEVLADLAPVPPVACDAASLNLVLMNVLLNAAEAIEKRGTIRVSTRQEGRKALLTVEDDGKGIAPEDIGRVFEPFFTTKDVGKGIGLGLTIAYDIVKGCGGDISVESRVGAGSRFTIALPT